MICTRCRSAVTDRGRFCSNCGALVPRSGSDPPDAGPDSPTVFSPGPAHTRTPPSSASRHASDPGDGSRFAPGALFAERYRIVGHLGTGGMGVVYRADDLKLGQPVALKFLPESFTSDPDHLERFMKEVRIARQVSHPNVCRVYDVGEADGEHYLSMEYIDGEDLGSLLRRIGHLAEDKALETARQLCAGLAAAHENGVLHRDLKPANVMIDGRGRVRITDFGLAGFETEIQDHEIRSGTPRYMAPEQMEGTEVTVRSDVYSLGLVLYEMFTGKRVFEGRSFQEIATELRESTPASPSTVVPNLDPAIERVIQRCLEKDPSLRPPSALAVAASLPGADPLAAALAAGEVPSPDLVAASGAEGSLRPWIAIASLVVFLGALATLVTLYKSTRLYELFDLEVPNQVLEAKARETITAFGFTAEPVDKSWGWSQDRKYLQYVERTDSTVARWAHVVGHRPTARTYWYRQSPRHLVATNPVGRVVPNDPPADDPGMIGLRLDAAGRLTEFRAVPPETDPSETGWEEPDWGRAFQLADLSIEDFEPTTSLWLPPHFATSRVAWLGSLPGQELPIRVEAAAYHNQPVQFRILYPWNESVDDERTPKAHLVQTLVTSIVIFVLLTTLFLARRNLKLGRGDRRGAIRISGFLFFTVLVGNAIPANHIPSVNDEWNLIVLLIALSMFLGAFAYLLYLALEPYVRRLWPETLISWTRLLNGEFRNPRVGRDVLIGGVAAILMSLMQPIYFLAQIHTGTAPSIPDDAVGSTLMGTRHSVSHFLSVMADPLWIPMIILILTLILKAVVRNRWVASASAYVILIAIFIPGTEGKLAPILGFATFFAVIMVLLLRFGLLSQVAFFFFFKLAADYPITLDFSRWYAGSGTFALVLILTLVGYAFYTSLGNRQAFRTDWIDGS